MELNKKEDNPYLSSEEIEDLIDLYPDKTGKEIKEIQLSNILNNKKESDLYLYKSIDTIINNVDKVNRDGLYLKIKHSDYEMYYYIHIKYVDTIGTIEDLDITDFYIIFEILSVSQSFTNISFEYQDYEDTIGRIMDMDYMDWSSVPYKAIRYEESYMGSDIFITKEEYEELSHYIKETIKENCPIKIN